VIQRLTIRWSVSPAVAGGALVDHRHLGVVPLGGSPGRRAVTTHAVHRSRDMHARLAGRCTSVVTTGANRGRCKQTVVRFAAKPGAGGFMATLAHRLAVVNGGGGFPSCAIVGACMASGALTGHRHVAVELARIPTAVTRLMTRVAIGNRYPGQ
jgi:hypothetical protein